MSFDLEKWRREHGLAAYEEEDVSPGGFDLEKWRQQNVVPLLQAAPAARPAPSTPVPAAPPEPEPGWWQTLGHAWSQGSESLLQGLLNTGRVGLRALDWLVGQVIPAEGYDVLEDTAAGRFMDEQMRISEEISQRYEDTLQRAGGLKRFVGRGVAGAVPMIPSIATAVFSGGAGAAPQALTWADRLRQMVPFGIHSFGGYAREAEREGAGLGEQILYGLGSTAMEMLTEAPIFEGWTRILTGGNRLVRDIAANMLKEGVQEALVDPLTGGLKRVIYQPELPFIAPEAVQAWEQIRGAGSPGEAWQTLQRYFGAPSATGGIVDPQRMWEDFLGGAAMGMLLGGPGMLANFAAGGYAQPAAPAPAQATPAARPQIARQYGRGVLRPVQQQVAAEAAPAVAEETLTRPPIARRFGRGALHQVRLEEAPQETAAEEPGARPRGQLVWHTSMTDFPKFRMDFVNTGIGQNLKGWGISFTSNEALADHYNEMFEQYRGRKGIKYLTEIPDDQSLLDFDKPLSEQPARVQQAVEKVIRDHPQLQTLGDPTGEEFYRALSEEMNAGEDSDKQASLTLRAAGVPGHRFSLQSDEYGEITNYVVYDDAATDIKRKYYRDDKRGEEIREARQPGQERAPRPAQEGYKPRVGEQVAVEGLRGLYTVVDVSDPAMVTLRSPHGAELKVGRNNIRQAAEQEAAAATEPVEPEEEEAPPAASEKAPTEPVDIFALGAKGEEALANYLAGLPGQRLQELVARHRLDGTGRVRNWKDPAKVREFILKRVMQRLAKGTVFREPEAPAPEERALTPYDTPEVIAARAEQAKIPSTHLIDTPERRALRERIANELYDITDVAQEHQAYIVIGPTAAGKSSVSDPLAKETRSLIVDADKAKEKLPEFIKSKGRFAGAVHQESNDIMNRILERAVKHGDNIVLPIVGGNLDKVRRIKNLFMEAGYQVHLRLVDLPAEKAVQRAIKRFEQTGRFVDPVYILEIGDRPRRNYDILKEEVWASHEAYSNDVERGQPPKLIESSKPSQAAPGRDHGGRDHPDIGEGGPGEERQVAPEVGQAEVPPAAPAEVPAQGLTFKDLPEDVRKFITRFIGPVREYTKAYAIWKARGQQGEPPSTEGIPVIENRQVKYNAEVIDKLFSGYRLNKYGRPVPAEPEEGGEAPAPPAEEPAETREPAAPGRAEKGVEPLPADPKDVDPEHFKRYVDDAGSAIGMLMNQVAMGTLPTGRGVQGKLRGMVSERLGRQATEDEVADFLETAVQRAINRRIRGQEVLQGVDVPPIGRMQDASLSEKVAFANKVEEKYLKTFARSMEKIERQQYSTPTGMSLILAELAGVRAGDVVLEPTAGTGSLLEPVSDSGATIVAVELEPRRAAILQALGYEARNEDFFKAKVEPADVIVMNPPFRGQSKMRSAEKAVGDTDLGNRFINFALNYRLKKGGRLVAITAPGVMFNRTNRAWREELMKNHTVRAFINFPPDSYESRGTGLSRTAREEGVGAGLLVVDKGKIEGAGEPVTGKAQTWDEFFTLLEGVERRGVVRTEGAAEEPAAGVGSAGESGGGGQVGDEAAGERPGGGRGTAGVRGRPRSRRTPGRAGTGDGSIAEPERVPGGDRVEGGVPAETAEGVEPAAGGDEPGVHVGETTAEGEGRPSAGADDAADRAGHDGQDLTVSSFADYKPARVSGRRTPGRVVEPPTLAFVKEPNFLEDPTNRPHEKLIKGGKKTGLSDDQLACVMAAKYNHKKGRGLLIADEVGMGKTGALLGIVADGYYTGDYDRQVVIANNDLWMRKNLPEDASLFGIDVPFIIPRDIADYDGASNMYVNPEAEKSAAGKSRAEVVVDFVATKPSNKWKPFPDVNGVMVVTAEDLTKWSYAIYDWLNKSKKQSRVVVDESHRFKHVSTGEGKMDDGSLRANLLRNLWATLKPSKGTQFVYLSATAAENLDDIQYMYDLGMWDVKTFEHWKAGVTGETLTRGRGQRFMRQRNDPYARSIPLVVMEQIVRELKRRGQYFGRQQALEGVDIDTIAVEVKPEQIGQYNAVVGFVRRVMEKIKNYGGNRLKVMGAMLGYMRRLAGHYRMQAVLADAKRRYDAAKASGKPIRIVFSVDEFHGQSEQPTRILNMIEEIPTYQRDEEGNTFEIPEATEDKEYFKAVLRGENPEDPNPLPPMPDMVEEIQKLFGKDNVAVITGESTAGARKAANDDFQSLKRPVAIISKAGAAGINLHDVTGNRVHFYFIDYDYDATSHWQRQGRSNRTGQKTAPFYHYPYINTGLDTRFIGTIMARMEQMGAIAKGKAGEVSADELKQFDLTGPLATRALGKLAEEIAKSDDNELKHQAELIRLEPAYDAAGRLQGAKISVKDFMNRLLFFSFADGVRLRDRFIEQLAIARQEMEEAGGVVDRFVTFHGEKISEAQVRGGVRLIRVRNTDKHLVAQAEETLREAERKLEKARDRYQKTLEKARNSLIELRETLQEELAQREAAYEEARANYYRNSTEETRAAMDEASRALSKVRDRLWRIKPTPFRNDDAILAENEDVAAAQKRLSLAELDHTAAKSDLEYAKGAVLVDGPVVTEQLLPAIRNAVHRAAEIKGMRGADRMEFRGYILQDGARAVGPVIPSWAEQEVAHALGASLAAKETTAEDLWAEVAERKNRVKLEGGAELFWSDRVSGVGLKLPEGITSNTPEIRDWYREAAGAIKFEPVSRLFYVTDEAGLKAILRRYPLAPGGRYSAMPSRAAGRFTATPPRRAERVRRAEIVQYLEEHLLVPIRTGRLQRGARRGQYDVQAEVVRTKKAEDLPAIAHEVGHHLTKLLRLDYTAYDELQAAGKKLYPKAGERMQRYEGLAEVFRLYLTDPARAHRTAPRFMADFERALAVDPKILGAVREAQEMYRRYYTMSAVDRVKAHIVKDQPYAHRKFLTRAQQVYAALVDEDNPIFQAMNRLAGGKLKDEWDVNILRNPYILKRLAKASDRTAYTLLARYMVSPDLEVTGKSLRDILLPVRDKLDDFWAYAVAKHALELHEQGKETGLAQADVKETIRALESPLFADTLRQLGEWIDNRTKWLVDAGVYSEDTVAKWRETYHYYIPFYRVFADPELTSTRRGKSAANLPQPIKRLYGSSRSIWNPLESLVYDTYYHINVAKRNMVGRALYEMAQTAEGMGWLVEEVPAPTTVDKVQLARLREDLLNAGIPEDILDQADLEEMALIYNPVRFARFKEARENILTVRVDGKLKFLKVHPELYRALLAMDEKSGSVVVRLLGAMTRLFRAGVLMDPSFGVRNILKDTGTRAMTTRGRVWNIPRAVLRAVYHVAGKTAKYAEAEAAGAFQAGQINLSRESLQKHAEQLLGIYRPAERAKQIGKIVTLWTPLEWILEFTDEVSRMAEYLTVSESAAGRSARERKLAGAYAAREASLDFLRTGYATREWNQVIRFLNASIQGLDKMVRTARRNPARFLMRGAIFTAMSLACAAIRHRNGDDDKYEEEPDYIKDFFWVLYVNGRRVQIPKPFEAGIVFGSTADRTVEYLRTHDPKVYRALMASAREAMLPDLLPTALVPWIEVYANKSLLTGAPIVPAGQTSLPAEYQYGPKTTEAAKAAGRMLNVSPRKVEHLVRGYTGTLGMRYLDVLDLLAGELDEKKTLLEAIPGLNAFTGTPYTSSQSVDELYTELERMRAEYNAWNRGLSNRQPDLEYYDDLVDAEQDLRYDHAEIRAIQESEMPLAEKRRAIELIYRRMIHTARRALRKRALAE